MIDKIEKEYLELAIDAAVNQMLKGYGCTADNIKAVVRVFLNELPDNHTIQEVLEALR